MEPTVAEEKKKYHLCGRLHQPLKVHFWVASISSRVSVVSFILKLQNQEPF